jgi:hypothetical protein
MFFRLLNYYLRHFLPSLPNVRTFFQESSSFSIFSVALTADTLLKYEELEVLIFTEPEELKCVV